MSSRRTGYRGPTPGRDRRREDHPPSKRGREEHKAVAPDVPPPGYPSHKRRRDTDKGVGESSPVVGESSPRAPLAADGSPVGEVTCRVCGTLLSTILDPHVRPTSCTGCRALRKLYNERNRRRRQRRAAEAEARAPGKGSGDEDYIPEELVVEYTPPEGRARAPMRREDARGEEGKAKHRRVGAGEFPPPPAYTPEESIPVRDRARSSVTRDQRRREELEGQARRERGYDGRGGAGQGRARDEERPGGRRDE
eukprot:Hpha_TRINITY_DN23603_c0_g1::TRINITY_DN23603_c0_g1_i1::g.57661::m.57661